MDNIRAYGAGLAGGQFEAKTFFKKPTVIFKSVAFVLGGLLWYCISKGGWHKLNGSTHQQVCLYGSSASTCSFASALGFFSLAAAGALLLSDARFETISSVPTRARVVTADLVVSVCFTGIYLIAFFTFFSKFSSFEIDEPVKTGHAKFGILLAMMSTMAWGGASFFSWRRKQEGSLDALHTDFGDQFGAGLASEAQDGYGYGGSSEGVGSVGVPPIGVGNTSYQAGGPPTMQTQPPTNPFVGGDGYGY